MEEILTEEFSKTPTSCSAHPQKPLTPIFQDSRHLSKWLTGSLRARCGGQQVSWPPAEASLGQWAGCSRAQLSEGLVMLP